MKRIVLIMISLFSAAVISACSAIQNNIDSTDNENIIPQDIEITLWTFPVGNWGNPTTVSNLISAFQMEYPNIHVSVEYLNYENGDAKIDAAIADGNAPDLILEGPERLVANWGEKGLMVDLADLWNAESANKVYDNIREACRHSGGAYYEFPICMTAHCMAINYDMFAAAGALQYIDEETHTWTTEDFIKAVSALVAYGQEHVGVVYCKNQSGDQGTRALVNNLYGGSFTDDAHTCYTIDSEENIKALELLYDLEGITFEPTAAALDEVSMFCNKELAMSFCWNVSIEISQTINNPNLDFEVFPMAFPTDSGNLKLQGGIWGFGIFDNQDAERIEAAKTFIRYMAESDTQYTRTVRATTYWPVRDIDNIYINDMLMTEYSIFMPHVGDYYQITKGWTQARAAWWQMLQKIGDGMEVSEAVKAFPRYFGEE